jgi:hypothetical protein
MFLRPGNAGANTVADHVRVLTDALAQFQGSSAAKILIRVDGAGATHGLLEHLEALNTTRRTVRYTVGWTITDDDERAIARLPEAAWETSVHQDGSVQEGYFVAELTGVNTREGWPEGMRRIRCCRPPGPLRAGGPVLDLPGFAQGIHGFVNAQENGGLERAECAASADRQGDRGHGDVVGGLPQVIAVAGAERVPEAVQLAADGLNVRLSGL